MSNTEVAKTILQQLGGNRFIAMTGANTFLGGADTLSFRLPKAKDGINVVRITLTQDDLYTVSFERMRRKKGVPEFTQIEKVEGVFCDMLRKVFTSATGLLTSL